MNKKQFKEGYLIELYPLLAKQFDEEQNQIKARDIYISTFYDKRVFHWKCPNCNNEWPTSMYSRLKNQVSWNQLKCWQCAGGLSFPQLAICIHFEKIIKQVFPNANVASATYKGFEIDITVIINKINKGFGIEYDSEYYHKDRVDFDKLKNEGVADQYYLIRVREEGLPSLTDSKVKEIPSPRFPREKLCNFDKAIRNCFELFVEFLKKHSSMEQEELRGVSEKIYHLATMIDTKSIEPEIYNVSPK